MIKGMKDFFGGKKDKYKTFQEKNLAFLEDEVNQYLEENDCRIISQSISSTCVPYADGDKEIIYTASLHVEKIGR